MKRVLMLLILISTLTQAQGSFSAKNNNLIWAKNFSATGSIDDAIRALKLKGNINFGRITESSADFTADFPSEALKQFGYKTMSYPSIMMNGAWIKGMIEKSNEGYIATIYSIEIIDPFTKSKQNLAGFIIKNNEIKSGKDAAKMLTVYDAYFTDLLTNK